MGVDGSNKKRICMAEGKEQYVTWAGNGYLYWSQCDHNIFRVKADGTEARQTIYTYTENVHNAGFSQDAKRVTWTYPAWSNAGYDFTTRELKTFGVGCHCPISPSGVQFLHNQPGHEFALVRNYETGAEVYRFYPPGRQGTFNLHRYSHSSEDHIMYTMEGTNIGYLGSGEGESATFRIAQGSGIVAGARLSPLAGFGVTVSTEGGGLLYADVDGAFPLEIGVYGADGSLVCGRRVDATGRYRIAGRLAAGVHLVEIRDRSGRTGYEHVIVR